MHVRDDRRAVSPEEKEEILRRLGELWTQFPALRFGQLLANAPVTRMLPHVEDFRLVQELEDFYNRPARFTPEGWK